MYEVLKKEIKNIYEAFLQSIHHTVGDTRRRYESASSEFDSYDGMFTYFNGTSLPAEIPMDA